MENNQEITKEELISLINAERKMSYFEEKCLFEKYLINAISRILDLRDLERNIIQEEKRIRKVINRYAKNYKNEKDVKKVFNKQEKIIDLVSIRNLEAVSELMNIIDLMINDYRYKDLFKDDLTELEDYYQFEMEDMVFVNGVIRELKSYNSKNINISTIYEAINKAIKEYVECIENNSCCKSKRRSWKNNHNIFFRSCTCKTGKKSSSYRCRSTGGFDNLHGIL